MRMFYDKDGKRISRSAVRERMLKESIGVGMQSDKNIKRKIIKGMSEEQYAKLRGMSYRDTEKKNKRR